MISVKKWPWVLFGTVLSLALWTFISVNTGMFENDEGVYQYAVYITSYVLVIGFWGLVVLRTDISEGLHRAMAYAMFILTPFFCMQIAMLLSGAAEYSFGIYFVNIMFYLAVMAIFLAVTRSLTWSAVITVILAYVFNMACFVVNILRGTPLIPSDFLAIGTAAQVAENYTFDMRYPIIAATVVAALSVAMIVKFHTKPRFRFKNIILPLSGIAFAAAFFLTLSAIDYTDSEMDVFDQYHANNTHGTAYSFYINVRKMMLQKPDNYSDEETREFLNAYKSSTGTENSEKPNIIVIMNESFADLKSVGDFSTNIDYMPFINKLQKNCVKGELLVSPFGGYTCNTEFEFLTGLSMGMLPSGSAPYLQYLSKPVELALPSYLSDMGYRTVALHPYYARCWNRQKVYDLLGFDEFISLENLDDVVPEDEWDYVRYYISDRTSFKAIERCLEKKKDGEPLFLFNVTMQNHGGYTYDGAEFPTVTITDMNGHYPEAEQYLSLIRESDKAFEELTEYLSRTDEKTVVVMFGDHQPAVEQDFFEELYGRPLTKLMPEELQKRYRVPFVIWTNYSVPSEIGVRTSTNFLQNLVLDTAGVPKNEVGSFTAELHKAVPQMNATGHYDWNGYWYDNDPKKHPSLADYEKIEYYALTYKEK